MQENTRIRFYAHDK